MNVLETMGVAMQNAKVEGQQSVLKPSYAKQRASAVGPVPDAVEVHHTLLAFPYESPMQSQQWACSTKVFIRFLHCMV